MFIPEFADFQSPTLNDLCFIRERPDDQSLNLCFFPECPDDFYYGEYGIQLTGSCDCFNVTCPCKACWGGAACSRMQMSALCKRMTVQRFWRMHKCGRWFSVHLLSVGWKKYQWILSSVKRSITLQWSMDSPAEMLCTLETISSWHAQCKVTITQSFQLSFLVQVTMTFRRTCSRRPNFRTFWVSPPMTNWPGFARPFWRTLTDILP